MSTFVGNIDGRLDEKGRIFVPAAYRKILAENGSKRIVMRRDTDNECLIFYPELVWNEKGVLTTHAPSTYKIPATGDIPQHFKFELFGKANREDNVGGSKAVGEPPFMLAISVYEALRHAIASARAQQGKTGVVQLQAPATAEHVLHALQR